MSADAGHGMAADDPTPTKVNPYLDLCLPIAWVNQNGTSPVVVDRLTPYVERYGAVVILVELLNQFAVRCVREAITTAPAVTHWVPALITGFNSIALERLSQLNGQVELNERGGRVVIAATVNGEAPSVELATITVLGWAERS